MIISDVFDKQTRGVDIQGDYNCFSQEKFQKGCDFYSSSVKLLGTRIITTSSDAMGGSDNYLFGLFGLNINDLFNMDYATFVEYDELTNKMTEDNIKQIEAKNTQLETLKKVGT